MYYLTVFKHFVPIFPLIFDPIDSLFIYLRYFDPSFLQNIRSDWIQFLLHAERGYCKFGEVTEIHSQMYANIHDQEHVVVDGICMAMTFAKSRSD